MPGARVKLSQHFSLWELIPDGYSESLVPGDVLNHLRLLTTTLLEPVRMEFGVVTIHSGWRPPEVNREAGGVPTSDHQTGRAADFHVSADTVSSWEDRTFQAHAWVREHLDGKFGQLILEDQRAHFGLPGKLWLHVSIPSEKHPGVNDPNRLLVCESPGRYTPWVPDRFA